MYMAKRELIKAFKNADLETVSKQCKLYGLILKDKEFEIKEGIYRGWHRVTTIKHHGIEWTVRMHNGVVTGISRTH